MDVADTGLARTKITVKVKCGITNHTDIDFGANLSSRIAIKKIRAYTMDGQFLGEGSTSLYQVELPAHGTTVLPWVDIYVDTMTAINEFGANAQAYLEG